MKKKDIFKDLKSRNLIYQSTNINDMRHNFLENNSLKLYCGFDPTADSLHVGHILPLLCLKRFQKFGYVPIVLLGGGTSLIGDPSFKDRERKIDFKKKNIYSWIKKIKKQLSLFLKFKNSKNNAILKNNYNWLNKINLMKFLRNIGKFFSINSMIDKDSVKNRLFNKKNVSISYTEFSYSLLQSYDYYYLYKKYNVKLQIGGSDQWGNITSGINLIKKICKEKVFGLTIPLLLKKDGKKFGKSEKETIWLDSKKTSVYHFYQFWLNIEDDKIYEYLNFFTFLKVFNKKSEFIDNIENYQKNLFLKKLLAKKMTVLIHGNYSYISAKKISNIFFKKDIKSIKKRDFKDLVKYNAPLFFLKNKKNSSLQLQDILIYLKISKSKRESRDMISSNSISINKKKENNAYYFFKKNDRIFDSYTIISKGKKNFFLVIWK